MLPLSSLHGCELHRVKDQNIQTNNIHLMIYPSMFKTLNKNKVPTKNKSMLANPEVKDEK